MKFFRIVSLLLILVVTAAWAPAPGVLAATAAPAGLTPASGVVIPNATIPTYQVTFTWTHATATSFAFQLATSSGFSAASLVINEPAVPGNVKALVTILEPNKRYYWRLRAFVDTAASGWTTARVISTLPNPVVNVVEPLDDVVVNTLRPTFTWDPAPGATSYELQIFAASAALTSTPKVSKTGLTTPTFTLTADLVKNTEYKWRVRSKGAYGVTPWYGPAGAQDMYFMTPIPPAMPVLQAPATNAVLPGFTTLFNWSDVVSTDPARDVDYELQITTDKTFAAITYGTFITDDSQFDMVAAAALPFTTGTYYWRVRSYMEPLPPPGPVTWYSNWTAARIVKTQARLEINIIDELTNEPIEGATVKVGTFPVELTGADGLIVFPTISAGTRSIVVTADDYVKKTVSTTTTAGVLRVVTIKMSKIPVKVVLTWGKSPKDLDANLWLPADRWNPVDMKAHVKSNMLGSTTVFPYAKKSADDLNGFGPETVTIQKRYPGTYVYAVYLNGFDATWAASNAVVKIYKGTSTVPQYTANVPTNDPTGLWWHVFDLDGATGVITPVNAIKDTAEFCTLVYDCLNGEADAK